MKKILSIFLIIVSMILSACDEETHTNRIYVFYQPGCIHCEHAHEYITRYYKDYDIKEINIREGENMSHMMRYAKKFKIPSNDLGTPFIVMGDNYILGWGNQQTKDFNRYAKNFKAKK